MTLCKVESKKHKDKLKASREAFVKGVGNSILEMKGLEVFPDELLLSKEVMQKLNTIKDPKQK
jgi:hypothetical protein